MVVIGLDIDSTIVTHEYPHMGDDIGAIPWLKQALALSRQVRIMLNTMRSGAELDAAVSWLAERGVPVWAVNHNPTQDTWTTSPKAHAHIYVDDRGLGIPLRADRCVDWEKAGPMLVQQVISHIRRGDCY